jgi:protein-tyrosine phosphatase
MSKIKRILFVCLGNTARSPAAEYLARYYSKQYNLDLIFESAGFINAFSYMQKESQEYLNSKNIDHSDFSPQLITHSLLKHQDLILTMEKSHSLDIVNKYSNVTNIKEKTYTLKEYNGETKDIDIIDPYYTSIDTYKKVLRIIDKNIKIALEKIQKLNYSK